jgi:hypothetical protein
MLVWYVVGNISGIYNCHYQKYILTNQTALLQNVDIWVNLRLQKLLVNTASS